MHSDCFNGIEILQGRWQHGEKVGYRYPSRLEKTLCKWDIHVPLVMKGLIDEQGSLELYIYCYLPPLSFFLLFFSFLLSFFLITKIAKLKVYSAKIVHLIVFCNFCVKHFSFRQILTGFAHGACGYTGGSSHKVAIHTVQK
jgi:hypothetical protein